MKQQKTLLIFNDGIVNLDDVAALAVASKSLYVCVTLRGREKKLLFKVFGRDCQSEGKGKTGNLLTSIRNISSNAANRKYGNLPLCIGFFGDGDGNVEIDIVNSTQSVPDRNHSIFKRVHASTRWLKLFVRNINSLRNRFKALGDKFFKFHNPNSDGKNS